MRYHIKAPGAFLWQSLVTESLSSELASGRIQGGWKIRRENNSTDYTVDQLCAEEAGVTSNVSGTSSHVAASPAGDVAAQKRTPRYAVLFCLAAYLVVILLWRLFATANEYDSPEMVWFSIGLDVLCLVGLVAARAQIKRALPGHALPGALQAVFVVALLAGVGLLAIRFTSDASWWTGHVHYECCPPREK